MAENWFLGRFGVFLAPNVPKHPPPGAQIWPKSPPMDPKYRQNAPKMLYSGLYLALEPQPRAFQLPERVEHVSAHQKREKTPFSTQNTHITSKFGGGLGQNMGVRG